MAFLDAFRKLKDATAKSDASGIDGHLAFQINFTDEDAAGICYMEVQDHVLYVEPYDYYDRNAMLLVSSTDLIRILTGRLTFEKAVESGKLTIAGDSEKALELKKLVVKAPRKTRKVTESAKTAAKTAKRAAGQAALKATQKTVSAVEKATGKLKK